MQDLLSKAAKQDMSHGNQGSEQLAAQMATKLPTPPQTDAHAATANGHAATSKAASQEGRRSFTEALKHRFSLNFDRNTSSLAALSNPFSSQPPEDSDKLGREEGLTHAEGPAAVQTVSQFADTARNEL